MGGIPFLQAHNGNYRKGRASSIQYIVIHYTANDGDAAAGNARYFASQALKSPASAHYFVDERQVWQSVKDADTAYHCGTAGKYRHPSCRNGNSLGIELCSRKDKSGRYYFKPETLERAAALARQLAQTYQIPPEHILRHYDVTGKTCPAPMVQDPALWGRFKTMIWEGGDDMNEYPDWAKKTYSWISDLPGWAQTAARKAVAKGIVATNRDSSITLLGANLQPLVWMDRAGLLD